MDLAMGCLRQPSSGGEHLGIPVVLTSCMADSRGERLPDFSESESGNVRNDHRECEEFVLYTAAD